MSLENHWGTHIDCPAHFYADGYTVDQLTAEQCVFKQPAIVDVAIEKDEIIIVKHLIGCIIDDVDFLMIRTGFSIHRGSEIYSCSNPGITHEVAGWLRKEHLSVRAIGFDFISLSPYHNLDLGRQSHKHFLHPDNPILVIEDMDLSADLSYLRQVWVSPLRVEKMDSAPCAVIGVLE